MRIRNRKLTLPLLGGILFLVVLTANLWATTVERNGRQILVDGAPFTIKGLGCIPFRIVNNVSLLVETAYIFQMVIAEVKGSHCIRYCDKV
jgi:hypothetical protein